MKVGIAKKVLDFPTGMEMAGYSARKQPSNGTLDPLEIFSVYLESDDRRIAIIVFDLLGVPEGFPKSLFETLVIPVAVHTHSAPVPRLVLNELIAAAKEVLIESMENQRDVETLEHEVYESIGVCGFRNVHRVESLIFHVLHFQTFSMVVFPCHPTVLGPDNVFYSSDLAGGIRRELSKQWNREVVFLNSCAGNISTRDTRKSRSFEEIERLSEKLAVESKLLKRKRVKLDELRFAEVEVVLNVLRRDRDAVEGIEDFEAARELLAKDERYEKKRHRICALKLGGIEMFFHPFEMFYESCQSADGIVVGYACGYSSYLVPKNAEKSYEWAVSPYPPGSDEVVLASFERLSHLLSEPGGVQ